jgi:peptidoglycan/xylan/chitin deacetylase (PgdA/CDA1 family)
MSEANGRNGVGHVGFGALVISLDFELLWGVRDKYPPDGGSYRENLLGSRVAIPRILDLFAEFDVAATWAAVGFLFANFRRELEAYRPTTLPAYHDPRLSPYEDQVGEGEDDDPLHFAPSLLRLIRGCPRQEVGTHTFCHYYCLEPGQTRGAFEADLASAQAIALANGVEIRSIVLPRNMFNPDYADVLLSAGIDCYRSNETGWMYNYHDPVYGGSRLQRAARKADSYVNLSGPNLTSWGEVRTECGLCQVPSSRFLRPYSPRLRHLEPLRLRRIARDLRLAASSGRIFHLWWHPHNFGKYLDENLTFLGRILEVFAECERRHGMRSLSMGEVADLAPPRNPPRVRPEVQAWGGRP